MGVGECVDLDLGTSVVRCDVRYYLALFSDEVVAHAHAVAGPNMLMHQQLDCSMRRVLCEFGCGVYLPHQNLPAHGRV